MSSSLARKSEADSGSSVVEVGVYLPHEFSPGDLRESKRRIEESRQRIIEDFRVRAEETRQEKARMERERPLIEAIIKKLEELAAEERTKNQRLLEGGTVESD